MAILRPAAILLTLAAALQAQTLVPNPVLRTIFPAGGRAGSSFEVAVTGADLDGATRLHFSTAGIDSKPKLDARNKPESNRFVVTIAPDARHGVCDVRAIGRYGISSPRAFVVGAFPESVVPDTHTSAAQAFKTAVDSALNGHAVKNAATHISFEAGKGRRVFAICRPAELDSRMDAAAHLADAGGRVLARLKPDGVLDFTPPADGIYTLCVHDLLFRGGDEFPWRIVLTTAPLVEYAFSDGRNAELRGRNLPSGTMEKTLMKFGVAMERLVLPHDRAEALIAAGGMEPARFGAPVETADADASKPVVLKPPCAFTGWFPARGRPRIFTFDAKRGDVFWIEVACAAKGLPADPFLVVEKEVKAADGKITRAPVGESLDVDAVAAPDEFASSTRDPAYRLEAKEEGTYRVEVRDSFCNSSGAPRFPFELSVRPAAPEFSLVTLPMALPKAKGARTADFGIAPLWRGGVTAMKVVALRKRGFSGPISLGAEGLPPGVTCLGGVIGEGRTSGYISFVAAENSTNWAGAIRIHGRADGVGEVASGGATLLWKVADSLKEPVLARRTRDVGLAVVGSDSAPVTIEPADPAPVEIGPAAKAMVPLKITRRGDFAGAFKLAVLGAGTADAPVQIDVAAGAKEARLEIDAAKLKLPAGANQLVLRGTAVIKHRRGDDAAPKDMTYVIFSKPVLVNVKLPKLGAR